MSYMARGRSKPRHLGKEKHHTHQVAEFLARAVEKQRNLVNQYSVGTCRSDSLGSQRKTQERKQIMSNICEEIFLFVFRRYASLPSHSTYSILREVVNLSNKVTET